MINRLLFAACVLAAVAISPLCHAAPPRNPGIGGGLSKLFGLFGRSGSANPVVFRANYTSSGALIADDANSVVHVAGEGLSANVLTGTLGGAWTTVGTVAQTSLSPLYPSGFSGTARKGMGPFGDATNYFKLGTGADALDFTDAGWTIYIVFRLNDPTVRQQILNNNVGATAGYFIENVSSTVRMIAYGGAANAQPQSANNTASGWNIVTVGRLGTTVKVKLNGGTTVSAALATYAPNTTDPAVIGTYPGLGIPLSGGEVYEIMGTSTPFDETAVTAQQNRVLGLVADTGQALTFSRSSTSTYVAPTGTIYTAPAGVPRITAAGVVLEGTDANLLRWSGAPQTSPWTTLGATVAAPTETANAAIAPDGTTTALRLDLPSTQNSGERSVLYQGVTVTQDVPYTGSIYLKGVSGSGSTCVEMLDATGFVFAVTMCSYTSTAWTRCASPALNTSNFNKVFAVGADLYSTAAAAGCLAQPAQSFYVWGGQVEQSLFPTTYTPTTTTTATRATENAGLVTTSGLGTASAQGRLAVTWTPEFPSTAAINSSIVCGGGLALYASSGTLKWGFPSYATATPSWAIGDTIALRASYTASQVCLSYSVNGAAFSADACTANVSAAVTRFGLGESGGCGTGDPFGAFKLSCLSPSSTSGCW